MFNLDVSLPVVFFSHTKSISATSLHPASSTFFLQQISTSYQPQLAEQSAQQE